ncbi:MAG: N-6 DNA methylase [Candidatus Sulfotelmatobacter sp.]
MMNDHDLKQSIETALNAFATKPLAEAGPELLNVLGYRSEKRLSLKPNTPENFLRTFAKDRPLNPDHALLSEWLSVDFLFQLTDEEVRTVALGDQSLPFESKDQYEGAILESYLFFALELKPRRYTRTELSSITRAVNRLFSMPVFLLFRHGDTATLAIIGRRLHKRDESKDVIDKVTLIKDIVLADPIRAHIEILHDLALTVLFDEYRFHNFVGLHQAWEKRLSSYALNERFYREVAAWYFWALGHRGVTLPRAIENLRDKDEREKQRSIFFIRLLTRLIFCWFLQEKRLIPRDLFRTRVAEDLLRDSSPKAGTYYRSFLQNLFFGTLNQEQEKRDWRKEYEKSSRKGNRGATNLWRYRDLLQDPDQLETLLRDHIPFVNGGLFDCLDQVFQEKEGHDDIRLDDFSEEKGNALCLPNELFFGDDREVDLSEVYDDQRRKREKVRGLIETLSRYKFTVEENTPLEEEIALDPELLGKVFENLLASYNEDTRTTARKALGGFYTPREIVSYIVDEALVAYLQTAIENSAQSRKAETQPSMTRLRSLFAAHPATFNNPFDPDETTTLIAAIGRVKILDPACGSGAFPMGALHRLVDLLQKLDPNNESWKRDRLTEAERYRDILRQSGAPPEEVNQYEARIEDIRKSFDNRYHALDFARKLYIIENGIYGVDIQPIATQIAKLRFFISLIVDQQVNMAAPNLGVRPLPNLETKIVAADALNPLEKPHGQMDLLDSEIRPLRIQLAQVRHEHFNARTPSAKARCRQRDAELRAELSDLLRQNGLPAEEAKALAAWDPYDQNHAARFFDTEWMFGGDVKGGFDIVTGNPPYVRIQTLKQQNPEVAEFYKEHYESARKGNYDLYVVFVEAGLGFLKPNGHLSYILPHKFFNAQYGEPLRSLIAKGSHLEHVVHFGDQQVFPGATNYVCLLFLAKAGTPSCRFVRVNDLPEWLRTLKGIEGKFLASAIGADEWNVTVGEGAGVFEKLRRLPQKLGDVARIWQGMVTGADRIFVVDARDTLDAALVRVVDADGCEHLLERGLLRRFVKDASLASFGFPLSHHYLVFPYVIDDGTPKLLSNERLKAKYPRGWDYLLKHRKALASREGGAWDHDGWYAFARNQNLTQMEGEKLIVQVISQTPRFAFDSADLYFTGGGNGPYYGVRWMDPHEARSLFFLQAILNSHIANYFIRQVSSPFRGGYWSFGKRFIERIPIASATADQQAQVTRLVSCLLWLNQHFLNQKETKTARDVLMLSWWEQVLNGLVYELYFPDELQAKSIYLFKKISGTSLPEMNTLPESTRLPRLRAAFEQTYETSHPLRGALFELGSVEIVRIIEGHE